MASLQSLKKFSTPLIDSNMNSMRATQSGRQPDVLRSIGSQIIKVTKISPKLSTALILLGEKFRNVKADVCYTFGRRKD